MAVTTHSTNLRAPERYKNGWTIFFGFVSFEQWHAAIRVVAEFRYWFQEKCRCPWFGTREMRDLIMQISCKHCPVWVFRKSWNLSLVSFIFSAFITYVSFICSTCGERVDPTASFTWSILSGLTFRHQPTMWVKEQDFLILGPKIQGILVLAYRLCSGNILCTRKFLPESVPFFFVQLLNIRLNYSLCLR